MPAYTQYWHPEDGAVTITGLTDLFDPNYYAGRGRGLGAAMMTPHTTLDGAVK